MRVFNRLGFVLICLSALSLTITVLLLSSRVGTTLQSLGLPNYVWEWNNPNKTELAVVVFGDSWVDDGVVLQKEGGIFSIGGTKESNRHQLQGPSWTEILCKELKCTSYLNFASSAPITVQSPPSGALTSNSVYEDITESPEVITLTHNATLPDFPSQISEYLSLSKSLPAVKTLFVVSFGLWDTYHYSSLALNKEKTEQVAVASVDTIFSQLDILFQSFADKTEDALSDEELEENAKSVHNFQVVIPQLADPTFLPGWRTARPVPLPPTSIAEEQKAAVNFNAKWNSYLKGKIEGWVQATPTSAKAIESAVAKAKHEKEEKGGEHEHKDDDNEENNDDYDDDQWEELDDPTHPPLLWEKTIHFPDLKNYFLDSLRTKYLETHKVFDANGLGSEKSPYESVSVPCAPVAGFEELKRDGKEAVKSSRALVDLGLDGEKHVGDSCGDPEKWLFWDEWNLGPRAMRDVGVEVAKVVGEGNDQKSGGAQQKR